MGHQAKKVYRHKNTGTEKDVTQYLLKTGGGGGLSPPSLSTILSHYSDICK